MIYVIGKGFLKLWKGSRGLGRGAMTKEEGFHALEGAQRHFEGVFKKQN